MSRKRVPLIQYTVGKIPLAFVCFHACSNTPSGPFFRKFVWLKIAYCLIKVSFVKATFVLFSFLGYADCILRLINSEQIEQCTNIQKQYKEEYIISESVSYEFSGRGGIITYNYPKDKQPDTKVKKVKAKFYCFIKRFLSFIK